MSASTTEKPANFIWYELVTDDMAGATAFYSSVVGWSAFPMDSAEMVYHGWTIAGEMVGGLMAITPQAAEMGMKPQWLGYVHVADVDAKVADIQADGGAVHMKPTDIAGAGRIALVTDPQNAAFYVMAPSGQGESTAFAPGRAGHAGWNELHADNWESAFAFYAKHFGWGRSEIMDMGPMGKYLLFNAGGDAVGGMMNNPQSPRPYWLSYFCVDDIDAAVARVTSARGIVLHGPQQVPGGSWIIQAKDPQDAMFALVGPRKG